MNNSRRYFLSTAVRTGAALAGVTAGAAFGFDGKPVRIIVPLSAGGLTDIVARQLAEGLREVWQTPVIVENRPGASGATAAVSVRNAPNDGHTLYLGYAASHAANVSLFKDLPYDPVKDFTPLSMVADSAMMLVVNPNVPAKNLSEFIAYAKANPGKLNFGTTGSGAPTHLTMEMFKIRTGTNIVHVPYRGMAQLAPDLLSGTVDCCFASPSDAVQQVKAGKLRALGIAATKRLAALPDTPTMVEAGLPDFYSSTWFVLLAAGQLPRDRRDALSRDVAKVVASPAFARLCDDRYMRPMPGTADEAARFMAQETETLREVIRVAKVTVD